MTQLSAIGKMTEEIMIGVQPRCQECPDARFTAMMMAEQVLKGEVSLEECKDKHAREIAEDCYGGEILQNGATKCWRGIRTPVTPTHLREDL